MNDKEHLFKLLRPAASQDNEATTVANAVHVMCTNLHSLLGEKGAVFTALAHDMQQRLNQMSVEKFSFHRYFSGHGPVATKLREYLVVRGVFSPANVADYEDRVDEELRSFDYHPTNHPAVIEPFKQFVQNEIIPLVYNDATRLQPSVCIGEINIEDTPTGVWLDERPGYPTRVVLSLRIKLPVSNINCILLAISGLQMQTFCYHPQEGYWLFSDHSYLLEGMQEAFAEQLQIALAKYEATLAPKDWALETQSLVAKSEVVFEHNDVLPQTLRGFTCFDTEHSEVAVQDPKEDYRLVFRDTRGKYPSRSFSVMKQFGKVNQVVSFEKLPELTKHRLVVLANLELDIILQHLGIEKFTYMPPSSTKETNKENNNE